jgi:hypothetical protein
MSSMGAQAERAGQRAAHSRTFEVLTRVGFVARGLIYGIIGLLAIQVAIHAGNKQADQQGAMATIEHQPFGHALLVAVAIGLGAYSLWRFVQAFNGVGPEGGGDHSTFGRLAAFASGVAYAALCLLAVQILVGSGSSSSGSRNPHKATAGALDWPGGQWIVGAVGAGLIGVGLYQGYKGISKRFLKEDKVDEMGPTTRRWFTRLGVVGHLVRMVAFGLIGVFVVKAAIDYNPKDAKGLDGALATLAHQSYGPVLLGVVALGFIAFGLYSVADARYRRI